MGKKIFLSSGHQVLAINLFSLNYLGSKKWMGKSDENWQMGLLITKHLAAKGKNKQEKPLFFSPLPPPNTCS